MNYGTHFGVSALAVRPALFGVACCERISSPLPLPLTRLLHPSAAADESAGFPFVRPVATTTTTTTERRRRRTRQRSISVTLALSECCAEKRGHIRRCRCRRFNYMDTKGGFLSAELWTHFEQHAMRDVRYAGRRSLAFGSQQPTTNQRRRHRCVSSRPAG